MISRPTDASRISAWDLRQFLIRKAKRLRNIYRALIVLTIVVFIGLCGHIIYYFNFLTDLRYDVLTSKGKVDGAIQYRRNLIPVLVESVVSFVSHEDDVFNRAVDARERGLVASGELSAELRKALDGAPTKTGAKSVPSIQDAFQRIMAIAEQYPQLKTSEPFQLLMKQVADAEEKIFAERTKYNDHVNIYTSELSMFPGNIYRRIFDFPIYEYFKERPKPEWPAVRVTRAADPSPKDG